jgi:hypothetical protein
MKPEDERPLRDRPSHTPSPLSATRGIVRSTGMPRVVPLFSTFVSCAVASEKRKSASSRISVPWKAS